MKDEKDAAGNEQYQFHTDLPPQPFQGNPKAPIWILMLTPCYSDDDSIILALKEVEEFRILNFIMTSMGEAVVLSPPELQQKILDAAEKIKKNQAAINSTT